MILVRKRRLQKKSSYRSSFFYKAVLAKLYPNSRSKVYESTAKLIGQAHVSITIETLYNIKILFCIVTAVICLLISTTNIRYKTSEMLSEVEGIGTINGELLHAIETEIGRAALTLSKPQVVEKIQQVMESWHKKKRAQIVYDNNNIKSAQSIHYNNNIKSAQTAPVLYDDLMQYYKAQEIDYINIAMLAIAAFFIPEVFLLLRAKLLKYMAYNEFIFLQVATLMTGKLEPVKVEEILTVLSEHSKIFKRHIDEIRHSYFDVRGGHERAFEPVIKKCSDKDFRYLLKTLQQASQYDLRLSMQNLENQMESSKEYRKIKESAKLKKKDVAALLIVMLVLAAMCMYIFAPFGKLIDGFNL